MRKGLRKIAVGLAAATALGLGTVGAAHATQTLKMATIAPGTSAYLTMSTMATIVNQQQKEFEITVDATGAATKHMVEVAQGKLDFSMSSPTVYAFMKKGAAMYQKLADAPKLADDLRLVFWFPYGAYHVITRAEDNIDTFAKLKGKRVFLGPPGGGAWNTSMRLVKATTGMEPGNGYHNVKASWSSAFQSFQDRQIDVLIVGCVAPCPQVEQIAATSKLRLIGLTQELIDKAPADLKTLYTERGRTMDKIRAGVYGDGVVNKEDVLSIGSVVGVSARVNLPDEAVYKVTKAFWEGAEKMRASTPWLRRITLDYAVQEGGMRLHPGALRFYKEVGVKVPAGSM
jgi:TRAP transporter TAXI family solute receptor